MMDNFDSLFDAPQPAKGVKPAPNYDALFEPNAKPNMLLAADANPEQEAEKQRLSKRYNLTPEMAGQFLEDYRARAKADDTDALTAKAPRVRSWLASDVQRAKIAADDVENMSAIESAYRTGKAYGGAAVQGVVGTVGGGTLTGLSETFDIAARSLRGAVAPFLPEGVVEFMDRTTLPEWLDPKQQLLTKPGKGLNEIGEMAGPAKEDRSFGTDVAQGIGQVGGQIAAALLSGGASTGMLFAQGVDQMAEKTAHDEAAQAEKDLATLMGASWTMITERYGLDKLLNRVPPQVKNAALRKVADIAAGAGIEAAQEAAEALGQDVIRKVLTNPDAQIGESVVREASVAGVVGGIVRAALGVRDRGTMAQEAIADADAMDKVSQLAAASKVRERSADDWRSFMQTVTEDGPVKDVYVNASDLDEGTLRQLVAASPAAAQQAAESLASGVDMQIPVAEFGANVAGQEFAQSIIPHIKTDPNGFSKTTAEAFLKTPEAESLRAEVEATIAKQDRAEAFNASRQAVERAYTEALIATGRYSKDTAGPNAALMAAQYASLADAIGVTPEEAYRQYRVPVAGEQMAGGFEQGGALSDVLQAWQSEGIKAEATEDATSVTLDRIEVPSGQRGQGAGTRAMQNLVAYADSVGKRIELRASGAYGGDKARLVQFYRRFGFEPAEKGAANPKRDTKMVRQAARPFSQLATPPAEQTTDPEGNPVIRSADVEIAYAQPTERLEFIPTEGQQLWNMAIMSPDNQYLGYAELVYEGGKVTGLYDIEIDPDSRGKDVATNVISAILASNPDGKVLISNVVPAARGFWAKVGVPEQNVGEGDAYDGYLDWDTFSQSEAGRGQAQARGNAGASGGGQPGVQGRAAGTEGGVLEQEKRGTYNPATQTIAILKASNLSTFLHEVGHAFLDIRSKIAAQPNAPQQIRDDMGALLKWFGIEDEKGGRSALQVWMGMTVDQQREHHEKFARGFERYALEGKAPSVALAGAFQRFRSWLRRIYSSFRALNVDLPDEVRAVMDRMIATEQEVADAQAAQSMGLMFTEEDAKKFGVGYRAYQDAAKQGTEDAETELGARRLQDLKWMDNAKSAALRALQRQARELRQATTDEVTAEVDAMPIYKARAALDEAAQLDDASRDELKDWRGREAAAQERAREQVKAEITPPELAGLDKARFIRENRREIEALTMQEMVKWHKDNPQPVPRLPDIAFDAIAEENGFTSGDEMLQTLKEQPRRTDLIRSMTDQRMLERYGDITNPEEMRLAALEAVGNKMRARVIETELSALEKAAKVDRKTVKEAAKQFAEQVVARQKVGELRPAKFEAAARRAAEAAQKALKKGDIAGAAKQKRNELINAYAARAAHKARRDVDASLDALRKIEKSQSIDIDYKDQIDTLLERFDLNRSTSKRTIDKRKGLAAWIADQQDLGIDPDLPPDVMNEALRKSYKDMSVEDFRGLVDSVKQIEHLGRLKNKLLTAKDKRDFEAIRDELVASIEGNATKQVDNRTRDTLLSGSARLFDSFLASHRKTASIAKELDGFAEDGPMWNHFVRAMNDAGNKEAVMREQATVKLTELAKPVMPGGRMWGKGDYFATLKMSLNRGERIVLALNTGNAGNLQRLLDGRGWAREQIQPALDTLTEADWKFVQGVWDFFESYRPQIAEKERRVMGKEPDWVEATPVETKFGQLRGGYYPIKYDPRETGRSEDFANAEGAKQQLKGAFVASKPADTFKKKRAQEVSGRPLLLTFDGIFSGANEVIHDLAWHEWVIDANRILKNDAIDKAIRGGYGAETMAQLKGAVQDIAAGEAGKVDALSKVLSPLRAGAVVAGLGFNLTNAMLQPLGLTQSMVRIGPKWVAQGIAAWAKSPVGMVRDVHAKSDFMRLRAKTQQRELNEIQSVIQGRNPVRRKLDALMFTPMTSMQLVADMPTWWGAYQKALASGADESKSVALADQAVIDAQGGGQVKDLSAIQRGPSLLKLFTVFYGYFNTSYNLGVERAKATNYRDPLQVMHLAWDFLLLYSAPAVLSVLLKEAVMMALGGGDDDDKTLAEKLAAEQISFLMGQMIGLREFTGAGQYALGFKQFDTSYGGPAGLRFMQEVDKLGKQIGQGELDRAFFRAAVNVGGVALHLPSAQINRTVDGVIAISEGKTANPGVLLFGPPKE